MRIQGISFVSFTVALLCAGSARAQQVKFTFFGNAGESLGTSVAGVGDLNNDGYDDVVAGAPNADIAFTDDGYVRAYSGANGAVLWTRSGSAANAFFGRSVAACGDVDLDGFPEVIAGAATDMSGAPNYAKVLTSTGIDKYTVTANASFGPGPTFGYSVAGGVDLDANGFTDFVVGAMTADGPNGSGAVPGGVDAGAVVIYDGQTGGESTTLFGTNYSDLFGASVAMLIAAPPNAAFGNVAVGAIQGGGGPGGSRTGSMSIWSGLSRSYVNVTYGESDGDQFGNAVASLGDVTGDGIEDLGVGAPQSALATPLNLPGKAYIYSGANYATQLTVMTGTAANEGFGYALASAGNVDPETSPTQLAEIVVGVPNGSNNVSGAGNARIVRHDVSGSTLTALQTLRNASGFNSGERFGFALGSAGDIDRDGQKDFIIGSPQATHLTQANAGAVYVMVSDRKKQLKQAGGISIAGTQTNVAVGNNLLVFNAGDLDADGVDDIAVGSPNEKDTNGFAVGALRVYSGKQSGGVHTLIHTFFGTVPGSFFGHYARGIDDITGDGRDDLLVAAPFEDVPGIGAQTGAVYAFHGATFAPLFPTAKGIAAGDRFGRWVQGVGDQNGDNVPDFAAGSVGFDGPGTDRGEVRVLSGATGLPLYSYVGSVDGGFFGTDFCTISDFQNNDGKREFAIGAILDGNGKVHVFAGGAAANPIYSIQGANANEAFGEHVAEVGDINADGDTDFAVSTTAFDNSRGRVAVYAGGVASAVLLHSLQGDTQGDKFGSSLAGAGDINLDSRADFLIGAGEDDDAGTEAGSAVLVSGLDGSILERVEGKAAGDSAGNTSVAGLGDINADLVPDYAVASSNADVGGLTNNGEVRLFVRHVPPPIACPNTPAQAFLTGAGKPGTSGVPVLGVQGLPKLDKAFTITLANAPANPAFPTPNGILVLGFSPTSLAFDAGFLLVTPNIILTIPTTAEGTLELATLVQSSLGNLCGVSVYLQALISDPGAAGPYGTAQSNRLQLVFGS